jgi:hypothetical protein
VKEATNIQAVAVAENTAKASSSEKFSYGVFK